MSHGIIGVLSGGEALDRAGLDGCKKNMQGLHAPGLYRGWMKWWLGADLNCRPPRYECGALTS